MKIFTENLQNLIGRRFDPEFHNAIRSTCRAYRFPTQKLRSLAYFQTGGTPSTSDPEYWGGTIPWVSAKDFRQFRFKDSEDHITELAVKEATTKYIDSPAMLMVCRSGILQHTLPVMICQRPTAINQDIKAFSPDNRLTVEFLATFFEVHGSRLLPLICKSGATVQSVNTEELMALDIPLPPLDVQRRIVAELDAAYAAKRAADQKAADLLRSIDDMVMEELGIGKVELKIGSLDERIFITNASQLVGMTLSPAHYYQQIDFGSSKYACLRIGEIAEIDPVISCAEQKTFQFVAMEGVSAERGEVENVEERTGETDGYSVFGNGDVIFAKITPCMENGKSAVVENVQGIAYGSTEFMVFRMRDTRVLPGYLHLILRLRQFREVAACHFTGSAGHQRVDKKFVAQLPIPVPSTSVQDRIVRKSKVMKAEARKLKAEAAAKLESAKRRIEEELMG